MKNLLRRLILKMLADSFTLRGEVKWIKSCNGVVVEESDWVPNQVLANDARGVYLLLDRLAGTTTYDPIISYADIGDDSTPATAADTGLGNALVRASLGLATRNGLQTDFRFYFPDATTPDDTYTEFGMVIGGTTTVGSGQHFNHLVMADLVKVAGEDHTIVCRLTATV